MTVNADRFHPVFLEGSKATHLHIVIRYLGCVVLFLIALISDMLGIYRRVSHKSELKLADLGDPHVP